MMNKNSGLWENICTGKEEADKMLMSIRTRSQIPVYGQAGRGQGWPGT